MKIIFCGPPHSGKSVLIANLIRRLPEKSHTIIRACPDGEGTWSNNQNQEMIQLVRNKGTFNQKFVENVCKIIDKRSSQIVLVDVGGKITPENQEIFKHCDSFVVLSNDPNGKQEWIDFGKEIGLECIASIDSSIEGIDEIYSTSPYLQGRITGLKRGVKIEKSELIDELAMQIMKKSKYKEQENKELTSSEEVLLDGMNLGRELGCTEDITLDGKKIERVIWKEEILPDVYDSVNQKVKGVQTVKINGVRPNYVLAAIVRACKRNYIKDIRTFDINNDEYISIRQMQKVPGIKENNGIRFHIISGQESLFLDIDFIKEQYSKEDYEQCILPEIDESKALYISGAIPHWLLGAICASYNSKKIYTFNPGKGFTCVDSSEKSEIGKIEEGIKEIDINRYFYDKKKSREEREEK